MADSRLITVNRERFEEIGRQFPGTRSRISPMEAYDPEAGVFKPDGQGLKSILGILSSADSLAELTFSRNESPVTLIACAANNKTAGLSIDEQDMVTFCQSTEMKKRVKEFARKTPTPDEKDIIFKARLSKPEAWVLGTMLDLQRQFILQKTGQSGTHSSEIPPVVFGSRAIDQVLQLMAAPENANRALTVLAGEPAWAVLFCLCNETLPVSPGKPQIEDILQRLIERRLVVAANGGYTLEESIRRFCCQFLHPDSSLFLNFQQGADHDAQEDRLTCLQSENAALYLLGSSLNNNEVWLLGGTPELTSRVTAQVMEKPASLYSLFGIERIERNNEIAGMICKNCGKPARPGAKFCRFCGTALSLSQPEIAPPRTCSHCGKVLKVSARFCGSCGKPAG